MSGGTNLARSTITPTRLLKWRQQVWQVPVTSIVVLSTEPKMCRPNTGATAGRMATPFILNIFFCPRIGSLSLRRYLWELSRIRVATNQVITRHSPLRLIHLLFDVQATSTNCNEHSYTDQRQADARRCVEYRVGDTEVAARARNSSASGRHGGGHPLSVRSLFRVPGRSRSLDRMR